MKRRPRKSISRRQGPKTSAGIRKAHRSFRRFSMRSLLICIGLICVTFALYTNTRIRHRRMFGPFVAKGASLTYEFQYSEDYLTWSRDGVRDTWEPQWLRELLGPFVFHEVVGVSDNADLITDADLERLAEFSQLRVLLVGTSVSERGVNTLCRLTNLRVLALERTPVTRAALIRLRDALPNTEIRGRTKGIDE